MGRNAPFTAAAVSRWEKGPQIPSPRVIEAIASLPGLDPGWLSHGDKSSAPGPRPRVHEVPSPPGAADRARAGDEQAAPAHLGDDDRIRDKRRPS